MLCEAHQSPSFRIIAEAKNKKTNKTKYELGDLIDGTRLCFGLVGLGLVIFHGVSPKDSRQILTKSQVLASRTFRKSDLRFVHFLPFTGFYLRTMPPMRIL